MGTKSGRRAGSKDYQEARANTLHRDNYKCVRCGSLEDLEADHIIPFSEYDGSPFDMSNLRTLCRTCNMVVWYDKKRGYSIKTDRSGNFVDPKHPSNLSPMDRVNFI